MKKIKLLLVAGACVVLSACSPQAPTVHTTDKGTQWEWNDVGFGKDRGIGIYIE